MPDTPTFLEIVCAEALHEDLAFLLIGGHAVNAYGYARTTLDVDFCVPESAFDAWLHFLLRWEFQCVHRTDAFGQFRSLRADTTPVDLMIVHEATFHKLMAHSETRLLSAAHQIVVPLPSPLHLIALKLHALRQPDRALLGKDLPDILGLIGRLRLDTSAPEFQHILDRYADPLTRSVIDAYARARPDPP